ncbi:MAG: MFS transporter [Alicyclobacillus sp.]|nr:MFS transporter [Alicyclobacillus sp.]
MQADAAKRSTMPWALGWGGFLVNADSRAIAPMLPAMAAALHVSAGLAGLLVTGYTLPYGVCQLVYGPLADRMGKVRTIAIALALFSLGTLACSGVHTYTSLLILRVATGVFAAGIIPTTVALIGDRFVPAERPRAIAFFMSLCTFGQAMGIVVGGWVAQFYSYRVLFLLLGLAAIPTLLVLLRQGYQTGSAGVPSRLRDRYRALLNNPRAWRVYGLVFGEGLVFYGGFTFLGVYGVTTLHLSYWWVGLLTALYSVGGFVGSRTITQVLRRLGFRRMPLLGTALMTVGYGVVWGWRSTTALALGLLLLGYGFSYCHSTLQTLATELLPDGRATALSVFAFSLFTGSGVGPMLGGWVLERFGMLALLAAATAAMAVFGGVCAGAFWTRRGVSWGPFSQSGHGQA